MYVIIICATLPTLPQCYTAITHKRQTYYNSSNYTSSKPTSKKPPIRLQRMPDASLFDTAAVGREGSQENILCPGPMDITKTTEVQVVQQRRESGDARADARDNPAPAYFPRESPSPFQSSR